MSSKKMKTFPVHPVLFAVFPVLSLYMSNAHLLDFSMVWLTLIVMIVVSVLLWSAGWLLFREQNKAGILASLAVVLITSYGVYQENLYHVKIPFFFKPIRMDHNFYLWSSLVLIVLTWYLLRRSKTSLVRPTKILNAVGLILVVTSLFAGKTESMAKGNGDSTIPKDRVIPLTKPDQPLPDIYYFVMDAYGRADVIKELYGFDNSEFIGFLEQKGFYVADSSISNYGQTVLSVPSTLNMRYADKIAGEVGVESEDRKPLRNWLLNNKVLASLRSIGYKVVATDASVFDLVTYDERVDIFYKTPGTDLNLYENHFLNKTILRAFNKRKAVTVLDQYGMHRKKILHAFGSIRKMPKKKKGPYFVYGHILSPHQPFVFGPNGEEKQPEYEYGIWKPRETGFDLDKYREGYIGQLQFVNGKLQDLIEHILTHSKVPPIIIIQGDHGPASEIMNVNGLENNNFRERMSILNAYYFPDQDYSHLYETISPVNSFKVVLNKYFGTSLELQEDKAMYSSWYQPYKFFDVTDSIQSAQTDTAVVR